MIYLDSAATTPVSDHVFESMIPWLRDKYHNPGAVYRAGRNAAEAISTARARVAEFMKARPEQIVFTSGGSEGNSLVFHCVMERLKDSNKKHIVVSAIEHDSVIMAAENLVKHGFSVSYIPVSNDGSVECGKLASMITPETGLVSVMYINNETGAINLVEDIGQLCEENGVLFHSDCVQAAGFLPIDVARIRCDYATISAHKIHGPKGVGCVYMKNPEKSSPLIHGGHGQEFGLRGGTENVAGIVGMGVAASDTVIPNNELWKLRHLFARKILDELGSTVHINGDLLSPGKILNVMIDGVDADTFVMAMDLSDVCISAGSACRSHSLEPSRTLLAMGLTPDEARSSVRISFSSMNTKAEVESAASRFVTCVRLLRGDMYDIKK